MKTTIQIPDNLFKEARKVAAEEHITMKTLIEEGLARIISERQRHRRHFRMRKVTFEGNGLQPPFAGTSWDRIREQSYEGRGG